MSTLSILHYVYGALVCLGGVALLILVFLGHAMQSDWFVEHGGEAPPPFVGAFLSWLGWVLFLLVETKGVLNLVSAGMIQKRRNRTFSQVVAAFNCINIPFGVALGVFTFVTLNDAEVKAEYGVVPR